MHTHSRIHVRRVLLLVCWVVGWSQLAWLAGWLLGRLIVVPPEGSRACLQRAPAVCHADAYTMHNTMCNTAPYHGYPTQRTHHWCTIPYTNSPYTVPLTPYAVPLTTLCRLCGTPCHLTYRILNIQNQVSCVMRYALLLTHKATGVQSMRLHEADVACAK